MKLFVHNFYCLLEGVVAARAHTHTHISKCSVLIGEVRSMGIIRIRSVYRFVIRCD